ncbi:MAG: ABC transporter permease subunit [Dictyoglomaceae bacterium]
MILKLMKKEWKEFIKTGKFYALLFSFLFFAVSSPAIAKFTPEIIKSIVESQQAQGLIIQLPPPTWKDSFLQYLKNLNQIIFLILVIVFIGSIAEEKNKGTAIMIISKGINRVIWVISKFIFQFLISFAFLLISYILCLYYTFFLFSNFPIENSLFSTLLYGIYLFFLLSLILLSSSLGNNTIQSAGIFFGIFILFNIFSLFPNLNSYNPLYLSSLENMWIIGSVELKEAIKPIMSTIIFSFIFLFLGVLHFNNQEL